MKDDWKRKPLEAVARLIMGQSPASQFYNSNGEGLPFLQGCAQFGDALPDTGIFCSQPLKIAPEGSVLFSVRAPVGEVNFADQTYCIGRGVAALRGRAVSSKYLQQYLLLERARWQTLSQGSTFEAVNSQQLGGFEVEYPENPQEQAKIVEVLEVLDRAIEQTQVLVAKHERIKTGLMQDLLSRGLDENGQLRDPATHAFEDSPIGRIPAEWECRVFGTMLLSVEGGSSPICSDEPATANEWGVLKVSAVGRGKYLPSENKRIKNPLHINSDIEVRQGDVLITRSNTEQLVGFACYVAEQTASHLMLSDLTLRLNLNKRYCEPEFAALSLSSEALRQQIQMHAVGSSASMKKINRNIIRAFNVKMPQLEEQRRILQVLAGFDALRSQQRTHLAKLHKLKTGLMQDLLTGHVSVAPLLEPTP